MHVKHTMGSALAIVIALGLASALPVAAQINTIANFNTANGANPVAGLTFDSLGNLYGTTENGGASGLGTIFEVQKGSNSITDLANFTGANGANPLAGLTFDSLNNLYGTTEFGGPGYSGPSTGNGTVFEVPKGGNSITALANFNGTNGNGSAPDGNLTFDSQGNLYGMTESGGISGNGTVFEVKSGSSAITSLASFNGTNGAAPYGSLIFDSFGNLYGTTDVGGAFNDGTVFEVAKGSNAITDLASFNGVNGAYPLASLTLDSQGNFYGTTVNGGLGYSGGTTGNGTVFEVKSGSNAITDLAFFNGANGSTPQGSLTFDSLGNLYGTTLYGGPGYSGKYTGNGTVFELANPNAMLTPESSGLANMGGALLALGLGGLGAVVKKRKKQTP